MSGADLTLLQSWVEGEQKALEWLVGDRTFQICGLRGSVGFHERFFPKDAPSSYRLVSLAEMLVALQEATSEFELYRGPKGSGKVYPAAQAVLAAAKQWHGL